MIAHLLHWTQKPGATTGAFRAACRKDSFTSVHSLLGDISEQHAKFSLKPFSNFPQSSQIIVKFDANIGYNIFSKD